MTCYHMTIGDGCDARKDWNIAFDRSIPMSEDDFRFAVIFALCPTVSDEALIEAAEVHNDDGEFTLIVNEDADGSCAPNGGPWLVARLVEMEV